MAVDGLARAAPDHPRYLLVLLHIGGSQVHEGQEALRPEAGHPGVQRRPSGAQRLPCLGGGLRGRN